MVSQRMNKVRILKTSIWMVLVVVFVRFYFVDVVEKFRKDIKNFSEYDKEIDSIEMPDLSLCPLPTVIPEKAQKYGITEDFFRNPMLHQNAINNLSKNMTYDELYFENHFRVQRDFDIYVIGTNEFQKHRDFTKGAQLKVGENIVKLNEEVQNITLIESATFWNGLCYSLVSNFTISAKDSPTVAITTKNNG